jgi:hypothetical protein
MGVSGRRAAVAVLLPREHLPFIRGWCEANAEQGWETVLYDNTGSVGSRRESAAFHVSRWKAVGKDSRGNDYSPFTAQLTDAEVQDRLREEVRGLPVTVVPWQPRDAEGRILFDQVEAYADYIVRHRDDVDWAAFIDCDEYIYSAQGYTWDELLSVTADAGCHRILLNGTEYESRWTPDGIPRPVESLRRVGPQPQAPKNIVRPSKVVRADVHWAWTMQDGDLHSYADEAQYGFRHYKSLDRPELSVEVDAQKLRTYIDESVPVTPKTP